MNPGNEFFVKAVKAGIYVDKTGLIGYMNNRIGKTKNLIASSRPSRFGKTMAAQMLAAYYSRGCDSRELFSGLEISRDESFDRHLNKYDVIYMDIQQMRNSAIPMIKTGIFMDVVDYLHKEVIKELRKEFTEYVDENEISLPLALAKINIKIKRRFVFIIDEWDCVFRNDIDNEDLQIEYMNFLRGLFKGGPAEKYVRLAYITGILPLKKYGTQSSLNNFRELTMANPAGIMKYIGFTEDEVKNLCERYTIPFREMQRWYDGYVFDIETFSVDDEDDEQRCTMFHIFNPNSVMGAIYNKDFQSYCPQTEIYDFLKLYISKDFDDLKDKVAKLLDGGRCWVYDLVFQNDMKTFNSSDEVLVLLVHFGYLTYDRRSREVFIPNEEMRRSIAMALNSTGGDNLA